MRTCRVSGIVLLTAAACGAAPGGEGPALGRDSARIAVAVSARNENRVTVGAEVWIVRPAEVEPAPGIVYNRVGEALQALLTEQRVTAHSLQSEASTERNWASMAGRARATAGTVAIGDPRYRVEKVRLLWVAAQPTILHPAMCATPGMRFIALDAGTRFWCARKDG